MNGSDMHGFRVPEPTQTGSHDWSNGPADTFDPGAFNPHDVNRAFHGG
ncbi:MAG TPA: hypothetical protein VNN07_12575 [Candidatus Tectomicrobia bacterium]|nr:hypothetical protein [Candidatus Tectomicrobia bacterium]